MNDLLIGTGFYCTQASHAAKCQMWEAWLKNTVPVCDNIVVIDNADVPLDSALHGPARVIRNRVNLGHVGDSLRPGVGPLLGWSMSWIQSALVAYSEKCDFIYKEQDCFAFGDWLPIVRQSTGMTTGKHNSMSCEQSVFFIARDFILPFIREYIQLGLGFSDVAMVPEEKFSRIMASWRSYTGYHDLPGGRNRPLPDVSSPGWPPFYAQQLNLEEILKLKAANLL
jgi:hypothetical protein